MSNVHHFAISPSPYSIRDLPEPTFPGSLLAAAAKISRHKGTPISKAYVTHRALVGLQGLWRYRDVSFGFDCGKEAINHKPTI
jgi:hypothetical protein